MTDIHIVGFLTLWPSTGEDPRYYANGYHGLLRLVTAIRSGCEPEDAPDGARPKSRARCQRGGASSGVGRSPTRGNRTIEWLS